MSERIHAQISHNDSEPEPEVSPAAPPAVQALGLDEVLDGIDEVLEVNALTFVQSFRQQGGQ
ncbi:prokaryotic ubiquitin-like protein Pup [Actinomyces ruminicola]|uniref:Prokaryotic ubiquitin-like protein Pup n=1 Tax=Actinomyces ruminicola TaxID=332524 RepID=A0A1H0DLN8_9ACTO|nr:ubiquitin-like protein Pup [Actinomyces ruminicola]SDN70969.1 prokaryotic ubiquitin-like protein Pup [Actinomyces ruminicola]